MLEEVQPHGPDGCVYWPYPVVLSAGLSEMSTGLSSGIVSWP